MTEQTCLPQDLRNNFTNHFTLAGEARLTMEDVKHKQTSLIPCAPFSAGSSGILALKECSLPFPSAMTAVADSKFGPSVKSGVHLQSPLLLFC